MINKAFDRTNIFKKYQNKWVAFTDDNKVISAGSSFADTLKKAVKKGFDNPIVTKMPDLRYDYLL